MKKVLGILGSITVFIAFLVAIGFGKMVGRGVADAAFEPNRGELLSKAADQINAKLPMMVDSETRLDSTRPGENDSFDYIYTLVNYSSTALEVNTVSNLAPQIISHSCSIPQMRKFLSLGITAVYIYRGNDGVEVGRIKVHERDCVTQPPSLPSLPSEVTQDIQSNAQLAPETQPLAAPEARVVKTSSSQEVPVVASSDSGPDYNSPHNRRCRDRFDQQTSGISNSLPIGEYVNARDRYAREFNKCLR